MKLFSLLLWIFLFLPICLLGQETKGKRFVDDAVQIAKRDNKVVAIEFWSPACGPCMRMKHDIFENKANSDFLSRNFLLFQLSPTDSVFKSLWKYFKLSYQSTVIYIDKDGDEIDRTVGYEGDMDGYLNFMKDVSDGKNLFKDIFEVYQKDTLNAFSNYLLAKKLESRYELKKAIRLFNRVLLYDPTDKLGLCLECKFKIADSELKLNGNFEKMREFIAIDEKNAFAPKVYEYLISNFINKKDKDSCISLCEEAFRKYPDSWEILNKYAWAICSFKMTSDYAKALVMVQKSILLHPVRSGTYSTEAWIHFEMGNKEKAIELQKKAIEILPHPAYLKDLELFMKN
jgi:thioredoxin-related protein